MIFREFVEGLNFWIRGWQQILTHRRLWSVTLMPFLISLVGTLFSLYLLWIYYPILLENMLTRWLGVDANFPWFYLPLLWLGGIVVTVALLFVSYWAHLIIAMPFYGVLSARTLASGGQSALSSLSWGAWLRLTFWKSLVFLIAGSVLLVCSFIPGLNLTAIFGALLLLAYDCNDYAWDALQLSGRARLQEAFAHKTRWCGQALALALTLLLPGLTLLVIPGAVVGAAQIQTRRAE